MKKESNKRWLLQLLLAVWAMIQLFPLYWLFAFSLKSNEEIFGENIIGLPHKFLWSNYETAVIGANIGRFFLNSVIVVGCTVILTSVISLFASYALCRMRWKLSKVFLGILMIGLMVPMHAALLPVMLMLKHMNLLGGYLSLIIPYTAFAIPMTLLIFSGFLSGIPVELEEAACIDGCSIYQMVFKIIFPLMKPAVATAGIFTFVNCWNELMFANTFVNSTEYKTLTTGIQTLAGQYNTTWGPIGAALVLATFPTIVIYILLAKQVQKSLVLGAVKG
ncbi:MAG: carbohydrate ABC transporter permease [Dorea sp.]|nr:carbohydrate ABC transporter permease [Dorea sp.]